MTPNQKDLVKKLLAGAYIVPVAGRYKLYKGNQVPLMWLRRDVMNHPLDLVCVVRNDRIVISRQAIRQLHGNHWIKKYYRETSREAKKLISELCQ
jgi:hypothetical protein